MNITLLTGTFLFLSPQWEFGGLSFSVCSLEHKTFRNPFSQGFLTPRQSGLLLSLLHTATSVILFISLWLLRPAFPRQLAVPSSVRYEAVPKIFLRAHASHHSDLSIICLFD